MGPASKLFSDTKHGGPDGAKACAVSYRDRMFADVPHALVTHKKTVHHRQVNNESGLIGVAFMPTHRPGRNGQTDDPDTGHLYWVAYWSRPGHGRQSVKRFPVAKLGFVKAWEAAVHMREQQTGIPYSAIELARGRMYCLTIWGRLMQKGIFYPA